MKCPSCKNKYSVSISKTSTVNGSDVFPTGAPVTYASITYECDLCSFTWDKVTGLNVAARVLEGMVKQDDEEKSQQEVD